ncbi:CvpA family protein [Anditalea andensis]|uniref:Colicin V production protein n=1 Tax=Anditalea andensis TaxID=1048983 RepID=A0A074L0M4_9BACT|nr:CvpA family protein [Anditalea andensis]KEO73413.1 colicin V production protein [Anditalea andensis]
MSPIDIIILILLAIGTFSGYRKGLFIGLLSIVAFFIAIIFSFRFMHWGAEVLSRNVESLTFMLPFVAFIIIFLIVTVSLRLIAFAIKKAMDLTILGAFDNFAGAILGLFKWAFMISLLLWVAHSFDFNVPKEVTEDSVVYPVITPLAPSAVAFLDSYTPIIDQSVNSIRKLVDIGPSVTAD